MGTFTVTKRHPEGGRDHDSAFTVEAESYGKAAQIAVAELNRRPDGTIPGGLHALRTTGDHNKSGWFQGYAPGYGATSNSTGPAFHVM